MDDAMASFETRILEEAAQLIEGLRALTDPDEPMIGTVVMAVDLLLKDEDRGKVISPVAVQCSDPRDWVKIALLNRAAEELEEEEVPTSKE